MKLRFKMVDVFTDRAFAGNPVAVILGADELDDGQMQRIANWTNLTETTFLLAPTKNAAADYRLRIFTPRHELPFAGHPTLGTAHAVLESGIATPKDGTLIQECATGLVSITVAGEGPRRVLTLELPPGRMRKLSASEVAELEAALGQPVDRAHEPRIIDVGPRWAVARLADAATIRDLTPDFTRIASFERGTDATGVTVFGAYPDGAGSGAAIEVRSFAPSYGAPEDPVCGSGNGCVAMFLRETGLLDAIGPRYVAAQGSQVGRDGRVNVHVEPGGAIRIGGHCVSCVEGTLTV